MEHKKSNIENLIITGKKVFTIEDLAVIWQIPERRRLIELIKYYVRSKRLISIYKGVYAYGTDYTSFDIAQKLIPLSYLSLYTGIQANGLSFQFYSSIFCMSLKSKTYEINEQKYIYHKIKEPIFYNEIGLVNNGRYIMANKERTICDSLYLFPGLYFDNLREIDVELLKNISKIYINSRLEKEVEKLIKIIASET